MAPSASWPDGPLCLARPPGTVASERVLIPKIEENPTVALTACHASQTTQRRLAHTHSQHRRGSRFFFFFFPMPPAERQVGKKKHTCDRSHRPPKCMCVWRVKKCRKRIYEPRQL